MSYFFNISVCLLLVILQTTIMPYLPPLDKFYDLLIPFIVYLSLSRPVRESLPFILFLGYIMDNLSGGPFGLYLTTYFGIQTAVCRRCARNRHHPSSLGHFHRIFVSVIF